MNHVFSRLKLPAVVLTLFCIPLSFSPSHKNSLHLFGTSAYAEDGDEGGDDGGGGDTDDSDESTWEEEPTEEYNGGTCGAGIPPTLQDDYVLKSKLCVKGTTITYTQGPNGSVIVSTTIIWGRKTKCFSKTGKKCDQTKEHDCQ